ncbi:MAG: RNA polymerase-associated protein RapA [Cellulomonadaceae bacterium TMED98]|nr:MAG: RNA polymerase-associated protein RapA [Cellulomonadaceae bacterium TMED98]
MAQAGAAKTASRSANKSRRRRPLDDEGIIPILARAVREVESQAARGKVNAQNRTKFQVSALLVREERQRVKDDASVTAEQRAEVLKRLDGLAAIMAKTAAKDTSLITLLAPEAKVSDSAKRLRRDFLVASGAELPPEDLIVAADTPSQTPEQAKQVVPESVRHAQLANPFMAPDFAAYSQSSGRAEGRLLNWELIDPIFRAFEQGAGGGSACMSLPEPLSLATPGGLELMPHQARVVQAARQGHRTFLLADEPGLGKTAQALMAADVTDAFPLLVVVPNVVKMNWAREVDKWIPGRRVTVVHGDGSDVDAFSDVFVVNYDILDRHVGWLSKFDLRGMVVDEAHFIKNRESQRSKMVQAIAKTVRARLQHPLLVALTGTPLINQIEDFRMIWEFLGWIDDKKPLPELMAKLESTELTPVDPGFFQEARKQVISMGIVRRRKEDVAGDIPARRIADIPVELDDDEGRSIRDAEQALIRRLLERYDRVVAARGTEISSIDTDLVRLVCHSEIEESKQEGTQENVFSLVRTIGKAKAHMAADYTAQLARNVGKVVFFAKHIDVLDVAYQHFVEQGFNPTQIRGDQATQARQDAIDRFTTDDNVGVIVCSLTAAGVGVNLQAASNVVLAELSWTSAEQTQAIDRVHRIGQELPVTAWRILAAQTIDQRIAELIDQKSGLSLRALDGDEEAETVEGTMQEVALGNLLISALEARGETLAD